MAIRARCAWTEMRHRWVRGGSRRQSSRPVIRRKPASAAAPRQATTSSPSRWIEGRAPRQPVVIAQPAGARFAAVKSETRSAEATTASPSALTATPWVANRRKSSSPFALNPQARWGERTTGPRRPSTIAPAPSEVRFCFSQRRSKRSRRSLPAVRSGRGARDARSSLLRHGRTLVFGRLDAGAQS